MFRKTFVLLVALFAAHLFAGDAYLHTSESAQKGVAQAQIALPKNVTGGDIYVGLFKDAPKTQAKAPVVVFLHGSSGINNKIGLDKWQEWLAKEGIASFMFDSMTLENRITYKSPADKEIYEKVHSLRSSEIKIALDALKNTEWADTSKLFLAGTSEGAVAVARYEGKDFLGKIINSWSCEENYFVKEHKTALNDTPVLNLISDQDKYFSQKNSYLGNENAAGNCSATYGDKKNAIVLLLPNAPHTLINLPAARFATVSFIKSILEGTFDADTIGE